VTRPVDDADRGTDIVYTERVRQSRHNKGAVVLPRDVIGKKYAALS